MVRRSYKGNKLFNWVNSNPAQAFVVALILAAGLTGAVFSTSTFSVLSGSNTCVKSGFNVDLQSNAGKLDGSGYIVTLGSSCGDEVLHGGALIKKESMQVTDPETGLSATAKKDFRLAITDVHASIAKEIDFQEVKGLYAPQYNKIDCTGLLGSCTQDAWKKCESWQNEYPQGPEALREPDNFDEAWTHYSREDIGNSYMHCFRPVPRGKVYGFKGTNKNYFESTFTACAGASCTSKNVDKETLTTYDSTVSLNIGDVDGDSSKEQAYIKWIGASSGIVRSVEFPSILAVCGGSCQDPRDVQSWRVTYRSAYQNYRDMVQRFESLTEEEILRNNGKYNGNSVDSVVTQVRNVKVDQSSELKSDIGSWVSSIKFVSSEIRVVAEKAGILTRNEFRAIIPAGWIGVNIPVAKPVIKDVNHPTVTANEGESIAVINVLNDAKVGGEVKVSVDCPSPLSDGYDKSYIPSKATEQFTVPISSGATTEGTYTCDVKAFDTDTEATQDTASLSVGVEVEFPDSDGDGVRDSRDKCPDKKGPESNNGCPVDSPNDSDGDGVLNSRDQCPTTFGLGRSGCPVNKGEDAYPQGCTDGVDNDNDGLTDRKDSDCGTGPRNVPVIPIVVGAVVMAAMYMFRKPIIERVYGR